MKKKRKTNNIILDTFAPKSHQSNTSATRKSPKPIIGTQKTNSVVPKMIMSYIHVFRLNPDTTENKLCDFFKPHIPDFKCEKLKSRQPEIYSSFKVPFPAEYLQDAMSADFWPEGVAVNRIFFKRHQSVPVLQQINKTSSASRIISNGKASRMTS